ncbi:MAG: ComF family protein [Chloroflexi bacterium]|nr:MAG: ComF family protein [Chloroflexota bacterium]
MGRAGIALARVKDFLLDFLFPTSCLGCGREGSLLCPSCLKTLPRLYPPYCERCGIPCSGRICPLCLSSPPVIDGIRSPLLYRDLAREAIIHLKYRNLKLLARPLAELLADYLAESQLQFDVLVPVPLHPRRLRSRGYNQSALLAKNLSELIGVPLREDILFRLRDTPSQTSLGGPERRQNVAGAFECREELEGWEILLLDDVCTTGATLDACAVALKKAGAGAVWGLTLAREA